MLKLILWRLYQLSNLKRGLAFIFKAMFSTSAQPTYTGPLVEFAHLCHMQLFQAWVLQSGCMMDEAFHEVTVG